MKYINNKKRYQFIGILLVATLLVTIFGLNSLDAEDDILLTKDTFIDETLDYSNVVTSLEKQRDDLATSLSDFNSNIQSLKSVYNQLPTYKSLGAAYEVEQTDNDRVTYLVLSSKPTLTGQPLTIAETATLAAISPAVESIPGRMSVANYINYVTLKATFQAFGISDHHISNDTEYTVFINPIFISPMSMQQGLSQLNRAVETAKTGLENGASQLYNSILMMNDILKLLEKSYESADQEYKRSYEKYKKGLISQYEFEKIENNQISARVNKDIMKRNISNMKMNLNVMRGVDPKTEFNVEPFRQLVIKLDDLTYYEDAALKNNSTIKDKEDAVLYQKSKLGYIDDYYSTTSSSYKAESSQLELYELELKEAVADVKRDIRLKYNLVVTSKDNLSLTIKDLDDANNQLIKIQANADAGFVAYYVVSDFYTLVIQKNNEKATKSRDYINALEDLYSFSGLKFPY